MEKSLIEIQCHGCHLILPLSTFHPTTIPRSAVVCMSSHLAGIDHRQDTNVTIGNRDYRWHVGTTHVSMM